MNSTNIADELWVVAACFNEQTVITRFIERVIVLPEVTHLLLIDDGSSDATVAVIRQWQSAHPSASVTCWSSRALSEGSCDAGRSRPCLRPRCRSGIDRF